MTESSSTRHPLGTGRPLGLGLLLGLLVAPGVLGVSAAVVTLPAAAADVGLGPARVSWLLAGYVLTQAMCVAVFGRLADVAGVRVVLLCGALLVTTGSFLSIVGNSFAVLCAGRLVQGAGAGSLQLIAFATVAAHVTGDARARALAIVTGCVGVISGAGTLIGGALTDLLSWRAVFALPAVSLLAMLALARLVPAGRAGAGRLDPVGAGLVSITAFAVLLLLQSSGLRLPGLVVVLVGAVAVFAATAEALRIRRVPDGFIPAALLRSARYVRAVLAAFCLGAGYLAMLFAAPLLLAGRSPTRIGLMLLPAGVLGAVVARAVGRLVTTRDAFAVTAVLAAASATGMLVTGLVTTAPLVVVLALGAAVSGFTGATVALVDRVPLTVDSAVRAVATGFFVLVFLLGGGVGSAAVAGLIGPAGLTGAVAIAAAFPAAGVLFSIAAGHAPQQPSGAGRVGVAEMGT